LTIAFRGASFQCEGVEASVLNAIRYGLWFMAGISALGSAVCLIVASAGLLGAKELAFAAMGVLVRGLFLVGLPAIVVVSGQSRQGPRHAIWKIALRGCPPWLRQTILIMAALSAVCFVTVLLFLPDSARPSNFEALTFGIPATMYAACAGVFVSAARIMAEPQLCANGHAIPPSETRCGACGAEIRIKPITY